MIPCSPSRSTTALALQVVDKPRIGAAGLGG
jgi:hypothetical protein